MSDQQKTPAPSRDDIRSQIFNAAKPDSKVIEFFGVEIELRQPDLRTIASLEMEEESNTGRNSAFMLIHYTYIPGTNTKVFEEEDVDTILGMPFGPDMSRLQNAISELTTIDVKGEEKNSESGPGE